MNLILLMREKFGPEKYPMKLNFDRKSLLAFSEYSSIRNLSGTHGEALGDVLHISFASINNEFLRGNP